MPDRNTDSSHDRPQIQILFVCLGNICRSPTAHAVFEHLASEAGLNVSVDSAGTGGWHIGDPPDSRSIAAGEARGYSFDGQSSRKVESMDFARFDYILAMDVQNLADLKQICPTHYTGHLGLLLDFAGLEKTSVPDPYYGGPDGFKTVLDLVEFACRGLIDTLKMKLSDAPKVDRSLLRDKD